VLGQAAAMSGDTALAARSFEAAAGSAAAPEGERRQFLAAAASQYYVLKEYSKSAELSGRYLAAGGAEKPIRTLHVQALYLAGSFGTAAKIMAADIEAEEQAGRAPGEDQLQMLANAYSQQRDSAGYGRALEKLLAHYPRKDYWWAGLYGVSTRPGFAELLILDLLRLRVATGTMRNANDYLEAAQLSLQEGFPAEATKIIDAGYAAGLLGTGAEAERHKRLKDMAARDLAADKKALAQEPASSGGTRTGKADFSDGFNLVVNGQAARGLPMMERGLQRGTGIRRPEHARLELAYAFNLAGQSQKAVQVFRAVQGNDGAAALARLWIIRISRGG